MMDSILNLLRHDAHWWNDFTQVWGAIELIVLFLIISKIICLYMYVPKSDLKQTRFFKRVYQGIGKSQTAKYSKHLCMLLFK